MQISDYDAEENEKKKMMNLCKLNKIMNINKLMKTLH